MKTKVLFLILFTFAAILHAGELITLSVDHNNTTAKLLVPTNQILRVISFPRGDTQNTGLLRISRLGSIFSFRPGGNLAEDPIIIAGPASVELQAAASSSAPGVFCTVEILPNDPFPADKAILVRSGQGGAQLVIERSTNLVDWIPVSPGTYTNQLHHAWFRLRMQRL